jgi:SAM-dependent methyltransferase
VALWRAVELKAASEPCRRSERPLLDLGCGDGLVGRILFRTPGAVDVGLDPWPGQLRRAAAGDTYRRVHQADGRALPYPNGTFATVFSNSVLEHIADLEPVLHEVGRVLRFEGRFIFTVPSDAFRRMLDGYRRQMAAGDPKSAEAYALSVDQRLEHQHYHTPDEWQELLFGAGLTLLKARYYMPEEVERLWDRMNARYGVGQRTSWEGGSPPKWRALLWTLLVSPHLRPLGVQRLLRRLVVKRLSRCWRPYYEMDVEPGSKGGGLLILACFSHLNNR